MSDALTNASAEILDIAERYRRVLNLLRALDVKAPERDDLNKKSRQLASLLESHGINSNSLLHDRHWAERVVPGSWPTRTSEPRA